MRKPFFRCRYDDHIGSGADLGAAYGDYLSLGGDKTPNECEYEEVIPLKINVVWLQTPVNEEKYP